MSDRGFTLIELLVVVAIIGLLATLAGTGIFAKQQSAERTIALAKCKQYHDDVYVYRMLHPARRWPMSLDELTESSAPGQRPVCEILDPDPWGNPYRLVIEGGTIRVWTDGPDQTEGTEDDLCYVPVGEGRT